VLVNVNLLDPESLITAMGAFALVGVATVIFFETATIVGSFLPGDSLLFIFGLALATYLVDIPFVPAVGLVLLAAIAGSQVGYWIGRKVGPRVFARKRNWFFSPTTVERANGFFEHYGWRALILARFIPVLRALVPLVAGIAQMKPRKYLMFNVIGGVAWVVVLMTLGYFLGRIEYVERNIEWFMLGFVVLSSLPFPIEVLLARRRHVRNKAAQAAQADQAASATTDA
jgi:membrane-associated protein